MSSDPGSLLQGLLNDPTFGIPLLVLGLLFFVWLLMRPPQDVAARGSVVRSVSEWDFPSRVYWAARRRRHLRVVEQLWDLFRYRVVVSTGIELTDDASWALFAKKAPELRKELAIFRLNMSHAIKVASHAEVLRGRDRQSTASEDPSNPGLEKEILRLAEEARSLLGRLPSNARGVGHG